MIVSWRPSEIQTRVTDAGAMSHWPSPTMSYDPGDEARDAMYEEIGRET